MLLFSVYFLCLGSEHPFKLCQGNHAHLESFFPLGARTSFMLVFYFKWILEDFSRCGENATQHLLESEMSVLLQSFSESAPGAQAGGLGSWGVLPERCQECWRTWGYEASYLKFVPDGAQPSSLWVVRLELCLRKNKTETTADSIACASHCGVLSVVLSVVLSPPLVFRWKAF